METQTVQGFLTGTAETQRAEGHSENPLSLPTGNTSTNSLL